MNTTKAKIAFTAPHFAAAQTGQNILEHGGTAIEAMVAAAASIAVEYPHMNGLGGDGFWLISEPGKAPVGIDASGKSAMRLDTSKYDATLSMPERGPDATITMAGAVSGWQKALSLSHSWKTPIPLDELLSTAIGQAKWGIEVTQSLSDASYKTFDTLSAMPGFDQFLIKGSPLKKGKILKLPNLANTLQQLAEAGLEDFYRGETAQQLANELVNAGSPLCLKDFSQHHAEFVSPISVNTSKAKLFNLGAPTQGMASLLIMAIYDQLKHTINSEIDYIHLLIEATKQAFIVRDQIIADTSMIASPIEDYLSNASVQALAENVDMQFAQPWPAKLQHGDTVWMGACDDAGRMVSYIQSLYWEFGSGVVSPSTGIVWNNRGTAFSLDAASHRRLGAAIKPFHTLNPAFADCQDGRQIVYGTMGGDGQPQTQATLLTRYLFNDIILSDALSQGRWLLGRSWGQHSHNLKIEADIAQSVSEGLASRGHDIEIVEACCEMMGHAGAIVKHTDGRTESAFDPRSDGKAFPE